MQQRIVFLDFDGVLNTQTLVEASPTPHQPGADLLDPKAVARLEGLCVETASVIVLTSTWRLTFNVDELVAMLRDKGLATARIAGVTPMIPHKRGRGQEIQAWLDHAAESVGLEATGVVILDDLDDMLHLMPWLVQTTFESGLTDERVECAKRTLAKPFAPSKA